MNLIALNTENFMQFTYIGTKYKIVAVLEPTFLKLLHNFTQPLSCI